MKRSLEEEENDDLDEQIALCCFNQFNLLSSRGKPSSNEWTHLAAFVSINENNSIDILSIGTGTKCLGGDKQERGINGCLLHDSHAEVIARRSLIRYFYEEILHQNDSILIKQEKNKFHLNKTIRLCLFVSSAPCGAAAFLEDPIKKVRFEHKSLNSLEDELYLKPGKGHQTISLSCTNKINRWIYQGFILFDFIGLDSFSKISFLGLEGSLLNQLIIKPIKLNALIIQTNSDLSSVFKDISVRSVKTSFKYGPSSERLRPCSMSIAWWKGLHPSSSIVTVDGHLLGQVKKLRDEQQYATPISKCSLFKLYLQLMDHLSPTTTTYAQAKARSTNSLRNQFLAKSPQWITTDPNIFYSFTINPSRNPSYKTA